jgi:site-specific DNA-methyltransferase (adenine-specific)
MLAPQPPDWVEQLVKAPPTEQTLADGNPGKGNGTVGDNEWAGWGTALKPAFEPVVVGRKPLSGTVAGNVLAHGVGALNIDGCRVAAQGRPLIQSASESSTGIYGDGLNGSRNLGTTDVGRWPSNVVIDPDTAEGIDRQSGHSVTPSTVTRGGNRSGNSGLAQLGRQDDVPCYGDEGGASRFFPTFRYQAKAPTDERPTANGVAHPTVKPLDLMRWLVRLVTPVGGLVLEPFAGSGTTAEACIHEHLKCIAIERETDYLPVIVARLTKPIEVGFDFNTTS